MIVKDTLYRHKVLRVNYTTYDLRRDQDSINPRNHADIMVLASEEGENAHPYWYARIQGVFHVDIRLRSNTSYNTQRFDFLWVRWFGRDLNTPSGWKHRRLQRLGFLDSDDEGAFGFLDPALVVRSIHLIPDHLNADSFYLNMFVFHIQMDQANT